MTNEGSILAVSRLLQLQAGGQPAIDGKTIIGFAKLTTVNSGSGASARWNWQRVLFDGASGWVDGQVSQQGPCSVVPGLSAAAGSYGLVCQVQQNSSGNLATALLFLQVNGGGITFLVTGNATGNGKYTAKAFTDPTADISYSSNLAAGDFGTAATSNNSIVLNAPELGFSNTGHDLNATSNKFSLYGVGRLIHTNTDGTMIIAASQFWTGC